VASISPAPLNTPNSRTFVALTRPRPSSSSRYCQRYPTRGPAFRLTMAKTVPSRGRRYRAIPIGSPASPASPSNAGRPPAEETSVSALPSLAIRNTRNRRRKRSVRTAMSVAWPCSISPVLDVHIVGPIDASQCLPDLAVQSKNHQRAVGRRRFVRAEDQAPLWNRRVDPNGGIVRIIGYGCRGEGGANLHPHTGRRAGGPKYRHRHPGEPGPCAHGFIFGDAT